MKPTKKKPAKRKNYDTPRGMLIMKLKKLATAIEMAKGPSMSIDDVDYRWVDDRIRFMERDEYELTKENMQQANELWRIYG
jgi:hypothetical protein|tara:strand:- start:61 stop:303 length:243 start_codon:yes stop_codon:yes gene_type:complete